MRARERARQDGMTVRRGASLEGRRGEPEASGKGDGHRRGPSGGQKQEQRRGGVSS